MSEDYRTADSERKDLATYTTSPLARETEITGPMTATLWAATSGKETDWNIMLQHDYPDGRAERIHDGVMRARFRDGFDRPSLLKPGKAYKYDFDLWFTSRVIPAGHSLCVTVASAAFPKYDRNLNTGGDNERDTRHVVVRQRILHGQSSEFSGDFSLNKITNLENGDWGIITVGVRPSILRFLSWRHPL